MPFTPINALLLILALLGLHVMHCRFVKSSDIECLQTSVDIVGAILTCWICFGVYS